MRAGALAFVLDAVRGAGLRGDTSITAALEALEAALLRGGGGGPARAGPRGRDPADEPAQGEGARGQRGRAGGAVGRGRARTSTGTSSATPEGRARGWFALAAQGGARRSVHAILARPRDWQRRRRPSARFEAGRGRAAALRRGDARGRGARGRAAARRSPRSSPWRGFEPLARRARHAAPARRRRRRPSASGSSAAPSRSRGEAAAAARRAQARAGARAIASRPSTSLVKEAAGGSRRRSPTRTASRSWSPPPPDPAATSGEAPVHGVLEAAARGADRRAAARGRALDPARARPSGARGRADRARTRSWRP